METTLQKNKPLAQTDAFPILGTDHVEFYVGNAKQAMFYYQHAFGFEPIAFKGPETGFRDTVSYVVQQGKVRFVLTSALHPEHPVAKHVQLHGDGVKVLALQVPDAAYAFETALAKGARPAADLHTTTDEHGTLTTASIHTYGDTLHTFVERTSYSGSFMPGFEPWTSKAPTIPIGLKYIDHCVGNVELGDMNKWVDFYRDVLGFQLLVTFDDKDISTEYTALMSKVVANGNGFIKFPINEPAQGLKKSQIEEYLEFYKGPGVQHLALATDDIIHTVTELRSRGVEFLHVPDTYYEELLDRIGKIDEDMHALKNLNILADRDEEGYLLQIFTKPVQDRPTVFYEIIQRVGATSFGKGNFKALFESIEREQALRGNL